MGRKKYNDINNIFDIAEREDVRVGGWGERVVNKQSLCFLYVRLKFFIYPAETNVRRERSAIESESRFYQFIWETIVSNMVNYKGIFQDFFVYLIKLQ